MYCSKCGAIVAEGAAFCAACGQPTSGAPPAAAGASMGAGAAAVAAALPPRRYAGFWLRLVAYIIDGVVISVPLLLIFGVLLVATGLSSTMSGMHPGEGPGNVLAVLGAALIFAAIGIAAIGGWLYSALMESSPWQATLGKLALRLEVTDLAGRRISFGRASGRYFGKFVTGLIPLGIGYILAGFTEKKQAIHDMIAGCLVLRKA